MEGVRIKLLHGALADSVHDFKIPKVLTKNKNGITLGDVSLTLPDQPTAGFHINSEHEMLESLLKTTKGGNPIRDIIEKIMGEKKKGGTFRLDIDGLENFNYSIDCISKDGNNDMREIKDTLSLSDYDEFFNLKGSPLNIVIDAQSIGMKKLFSFANKGDKQFIVNSIINREIINDPASKIYDVRKFKDGGNGVVYNIIRENNKENIIYTSFDTPDTSGNILLRNKFYSKLDLTLSPLLNVKTNALPRITLDILNKQKELIYQTGNPHLDNTISSCWNLIKKWFKSLTDKHIRCSTFFQCKRSGDWLQALSCIDIDRPYVNDATNAPVSINNLKLVTLDQILLWYSLFIGIDVIFTCTLPNEGEAVVEEAEDSNNDDNDDAELAPTPGKPKKILMYFTRSTPEDPIEKLIRYKAIAKEKAGINYTSKIQAYNLMIQEVVNDIEVEIDERYELLLNNIKIAKSLTKNIMSDTKKLLELNWKLTALDYKELVEPVKPVNIDTETIDKLSLYISECTSIDIFTSKNSTKDDIVYNSKAYEINDDYIKIINPFVAMNSGRRSADSSETPEIRCAKSCSYLKFRLPDKYIQALAGQLGYIKEAIVAKWPSIQIGEFAIVKIISFLTLNNMDSISDIIVEYLKKKNTAEKIKAVHNEAGGENAVQAVQDEAGSENALQAVHDEAHTAEMDYSENVKINKEKEAIKKEDETLETSYKTGNYTSTTRPITDMLLMRLRNGKIKGAAAALAPVVKAPVKPKIKRAMISADEEFTEYAEILLSLLNSQVLPTAVEEQGGGGSPSKDKSECAYILFLIYLNSLINSLNGYEMMNGSDYMYFDAVARIVISAIQVTKTDYLSLLDTIYIDVLDAGWVDEFISIENKDFKECVQIAAHNLALQSLNLRKGTIPYDTYKGSKKIFEDIRFDSEFKKITSTLKGKSFYNRKVYVISKIESYIKSSRLPTSRHISPMKPIAISGVLHKATHIDSSIELSKEPIAGLAHGGSKTRALRRKKRKNGSPRRKTLRKTRKHR